MKIPFQYTLNIPATRQHPAVAAQVGRVTVILGANGAGKSALIESLRAHALPAFGYSAVRKVDARRIMQVAGSSSLKRSQVNEGIEQIANQLLETYSPDTKTQTTAAVRLLEALCYRARVRDMRYASECDALARSGKHSSIGPRPVSALDEFCSLYRNVLPDIGLDFDANTVTLKITKAQGTTYGPETLSSGEQQIFLLLGKFIFQHRSTLVLVDEPELNLNPRLAERFWSAIEQRHPECVFIYATHALHFAMRPEVDRTLVLTRDGLVPLDASEEFLNLAREDREQFLGSIPSVVLAQKVLFTEGKPDSIDRPLYEYLLQTPAIKVESIGSCNEVEKAVAGRQGWDAFTRGAQVAGVIDADYKSRQELERLRALNMFVLPVHEAENLLCSPEAVHALSLAMHPPESHSSSQAVGQAIAVRLKALRLEIAIQRATAATRLHFAPSLTDADVQALSDDDDALHAFERAANAQISFLQKQDFRSALKAELDSIDAALQGNDIEAMLRFVPGKMLVGQICSMLGIRGKGSDLLSYYKKHFPDPSGLSPFLKTAIGLRNLYTLTEATPVNEAPGRAFGFSAG
jgi:ABC-type multidrug transport system ATPase subunit